MRVETSVIEDDSGEDYRSTQRPLGSLAISPNLDKLLEHEEWSRGYTEPTLPAGLPPPPRRNRQKSSRALSRNVSARNRESCSSLIEPPSRSSNPYINPAPTADVLFLQTSARPAPPGPSQRSACQEQNLSCLRSPDTYRFKAQTLSKGGKLSVSPILRLFANSFDLGRGKRFIPRTLKEDVGFDSRSTRSHSKFSVSAAASTSTLSNHPLERSKNHSHRNQLSSQPMSIPLDSPRLESVEFPLPTTKPVFSRRLSQRVKQAPDSLPFDTTNVKPTTTNLLDGEERADLVRKSRKLARLFGETPNAEAVVNQAGIMFNVQAHRGNSEPDVELPPHGRPDRVNAFNRRFSLPLSIEDIPFIDFSASVGADAALGPTMLDSNRPSSLPDDEIVQSSLGHQANSVASCSPFSFIESSDPTSVASRNSISSTYSSKTSVEQLEEDRRIKRDRLAKLYRFLGSQVPINLVLGTDDDSPPPPLQQHIPSGGSTFDNIEEKCSTLLKRRRSSSAIPSVSTWPDNVERLKTDLDNREKAIIVRRVQKMEKLFGVAPPLMLYHSKSTSAPASGSITPPISTDNLSSYPSAALKSHKHKEIRPDTPESSKRLLPRSDSFTSFSRFDYHLAKESIASTDRNGHSIFYCHYEHSLNSLNDIIDRDDKTSLAELHQALSDDGAATPTFSGRHSIISSPLPKSARRGSFPASMISFDSEYSIGISSPMPEASSFQQRRKRAAKLTQFFGVDYRELFDEVLATIENDMQLGERDGMLRADEAKDLLQKLRKLKYKRLNL